MTKTETVFGTVEEKFKLALNEEEILRVLPIGDPYQRIAKLNIEYYLNCAAALERGETTIPCKVQRP